METNDAIENDSSSLVSNSEQVLDPGFEALSFLVRFCDRRVYCLAGFLPVNFDLFRVFASAYRLYVHAFIPKAINVIYFYYDELFHEYSSFQSPDCIAVCYFNISYGLKVLSPPYVQKIDHVKNASITDIVFHCFL